MKSKREALHSLRQIEHQVNGKPYIIWSVYLGTDKLNHRKIAIQRASKTELITAIDDFYLKLDAGSSPSVARDLNPESMADFTLARKILDAAGFGAITLCETARLYCRHHGGIVSKPLSAAYADYLNSFSDEQTTQRSIVISRVGRFVSAVGPERLVESITVRDVSQYLERAFGSSSPKTWNNATSYISTFFAWCARPERTYCRDNPAASITKKTIAWHEPEFIRADTLRTLFDLASASHDSSLATKRIWFLALSFFCGIRSAETVRITYADVNLTEGWIRIAKPKGVTRGVPPRLVYLTDAAKAWMNAYPLAKGSPSTSVLAGIGQSKDVYSALRLAARGRGLHLDIPHNAGRHSFITMHVALQGDPRATENMVGTSSTMRVNHYQGLATKKEAEEYFAVLPA